MFILHPETKLEMGLASQSANAWRQLRALKSWLLRSSLSTQSSADYSVLKETHSSFLLQGRLCGEGGGSLFSPLTLLRTVILLKSCGFYSYCDGTAKDWSPHHAPSMPMTVKPDKSDLSVLDGEDGNAERRLM